MELWVFRPPSSNGPITPPCCLSTHSPVCKRWIICTSVVSASGSTGVCTLQLCVAIFGSKGVYVGCGVSLVCKGGQKRGNPLHGVTCCLWQCVAEGYVLFIFW